MILLKVTFVLLCVLYTEAGFRAEHIYPIHGELADGAKIAIGVGVAPYQYYIITLMEEEKLSTFKNIYVDSNGLQLVTRSSKWHLSAEDPIVLIVFYFREDIFEDTVKLASKLDIDKSLDLKRLQRTESTFCTPKTLRTYEFLTLEDSSPRKCLLEIKSSANKNISEYDSGSPLLNDDGKLVSLVVKENNGLIHGFDFKCWHLVGILLTEMKEELEYESQRKILRIKYNGGERMGVVIGPHYLLTVFPHSQIKKNFSKNISIKYEQERFKSPRVIFMGKYGDPPAAIVLLYFPQLVFPFVFNIFQGLYIGWLYLQTFDKNLHLYMTKFRRDSNSDKNILPFDGFDSERNGKTPDGSPALKGEFVFGLVLNQKNQVKTYRHVLNLNSPDVMAVVHNTINQMDLQIPEDLGDSFGRILPVVDQNGLIQRSATVVSTNCVLAVPPTSDSEIPIVILYQGDLMSSRTGTTIGLNGSTLGIYSFDKVAFTAKFQLPERNRLPIFDRVYMQRFRKLPDMIGSSRGTLEVHCEIKPTSNKDGSHSISDQHDYIKIRATDDGAPLFEHNKLFGLVQYETNQSNQFHIIDLSLPDTWDRIDKFIAENRSAMNKENIEEFENFVGVRVNAQETEAKALKVSRQHTIEDKLQEREEAMPDDEQ